MRREDDGRIAPRWRAILEARWRTRLQEVTELSMAYHAAAAGGIEDRQARRLLRRAVAARQRLADTEDALGRVAAGVFGRCEQCGGPRSPRCCSPPRPSPGTAPRCAGRRVRAAGAAQHRGRAPVSALGQPPGRLGALVPDRLPLPGARRDLPALPGESAVIALGVATAGSADPRIALLVACAAAGAFAGDNLSYLIGRRFGPAVQRRFFATPKGVKARAWAERSLARYGPQLIIVCRFIPGGRTAVTLTCGLTGYPRRRFVRRDRAGRRHLGALRVLHRPPRRPGLRGQPVGRPGLRRLDRHQRAGRGGRCRWPVAADEGRGTDGHRDPDGPVEAGAAEAAGEGPSRVAPRTRRAEAAGDSAAPVRDDGLGRGPATGHAGQVEADHPGQDQGDGDELHRRDRVAEEEHADRRPRPRRRCRSTPRRRARRRARAAPASAARSWSARTARSRPWARGPAARRSASGTRRSRSRTTRRQQAPPMPSVTSRLDVPVVPFISGRRRGGPVCGSCSPDGDGLHRIFTRHRPSLHSRRRALVSVINGHGKGETAMLGSQVRPLDPVSAAWNTVARFDDYQTAQRARRPAVRRRVPGRAARHCRIRPAARRAGDGPPHPGPGRRRGRAQRRCGQACCSGYCSGCSPPGTPSSRSPRPVPPSAPRGGPSSGTWPTRAPGASATSAPCASWSRRTTT